MKLCLQDKNSFACKSCLKCTARGFVLIDTVIPHLIPIIIPPLKKKKQPKFFPVKVSFFVVVHTQNGKLPTSLLHKIGRKSIVVKSPCQLSFDSPFFHDLHTHTYYTSKLCSSFKFLNSKTKHTKPVPRARIIVQVHKKP